MAYVYPLFLVVIYGIPDGDVVSLQESRGGGLGECLRFLEKVKRRCRRRIKQFNIYLPTYKTKTTERWIKAWTALS